MNTELAITELAKHNQSNPGMWTEKDGRGGISLSCVCGGWRLYYDYKNPPDSDHTYKDSRTYLNQEFARHQLTMLQEAGVFDNDEDDVYVDENGVVRDCYKLVKDGHDWDYTDLRVDAEGWQDKILSEEPNARVSIFPVTRAQLEHWKEYGI